MQFVTTSDNVKLAAYDMNPTGKKTIVLVHGWPLCHKMFEYQIPDLLKAGYRIVRFDIRGFGYSEEAADGYWYNQLADDLLQVVEMLELRDFDLLGFSMGGAICARYMARYNGYGVRKLILLDAAVPSYCETPRNPHGQPIADTEDLIDLGFVDRPELNLKFQDMFFARKQSEPFYWWFGDMSRLASGTGQMNALLSLRYEDCFDDLRRITTPTLIIHGKQDKICPFGMAEIVHKQIYGSALVPVDGGHGSFYEEVDAVNDALLDFISS